MCSSEEPKAKCTQKHKKGENCYLCPTIDVFANSRVHPASCIVVRGNWSEHDNMDDTGNLQKRMRAGRSRDIDENPSNKGQSRALSSSHAEQIRPAQSADEGADSDKPSSAVRSRLSSENISDHKGDTGPPEIGPGKHKQTKTSELRSQWMRGGYSLPSMSKKHLKEFNRLPFISCGKENRCFEFVTDRVQRLNTEKKEEMIVKYNKDPHFVAAKTAAPTTTSEAPQVEGGSTEGSTEAPGETTATPGAEAPSTTAADAPPTVAADAPADVASTVATPPAETTTAAAAQ